jgi:hypothetical protein
MPAVACSAAAVLIPTGFARTAQNLNSGIFPKRIERQIGEQTGNSPPAHPSGGHRL